MSGETRLRAALRKLRAVIKPKTRGLPLDPADWPEAAAEIERRLAQIESRQRVDRFLLLILVSSLVREAPQLLELVRSVIR